MTNLPYKHVGFNSEWAASKTLEEFIEHESHHGLSWEELEEAHTLCKLKHIPPELIISELEDKNSSFKNGLIPETGEES